MNETTSVRREFDYAGWKATLSFDDELTVTKVGETRVYDLPRVTKIEHNLEYIFLTHDGGVFTQVKFEEGDFLVIDRFDKDGDHIDSVGSHVFGEDEEDEFVPTPEELERFRKEWGQSHLEICDCLGFDSEDDEGSSEDIMNTGNYFWDEEKNLWLNKCASGFQGNDQMIADYLRSL